MPFDKTANITISLSADDKNHNANLLEICYKDWIQKDRTWQGRQLARGCHLGQPAGFPSGGSTENEEDNKEDGQVSQDATWLSYPGPGPSLPAPAGQPPLTQCLEMPDQALRLWG